MTMASNFGMAFSSGRSDSAAKNEFDISPPRLVHARTQAFRMNPWYRHARPWRRAVTFLLRGNHFLKEITSLTPQDSSRRTSSPLAHGRARSRDWQRGRALPSFCASPGHNVLDEGVAKKHDFKKPDLQHRR